MEKTKKLLLLFLIAFISMGVNAGTYRPGKYIDLKKYCSTMPPKKGSRSVTSVEASAYLNSANESIIVDFGGGGWVNAEIKVMDALTNEVICAESYSTCDSVILNMFGLLSEGQEFRLEIIVGDTVFYGDFSL